MSERKDGWEPIFLAGLAAHGNVSRACSEAGIGRTLAYQRREADAGFHDRWLEALDAFADDLESEATRRGRDGTTTPKWHKVGVDERGRPIYERHDIRSYSDTLLLARLKALRPENYRDNYDADKWLRAALEVAERTKPWKPE
jgi:hypothetical protein